MPKLNTLIFSKDRACQLDLLLSSLVTSMAHDRRIQCHVIYKTSNPLFEESYRILQIDFPWINWISQVDFQLQVQSITGQSSDLFMGLVDDDVFLQSFTLDDVEIRVFANDNETACLSLRMYPGITWCHPKNIATPPPIFVTGRRWSWQNELGDWGYPMSLDGHIFRGKDFHPLISSISFHDPNSLEAALAKRPIARPWMSCYATPRLVNIPYNRVQQTASNRHMGFDHHEMNRIFLAGERLDLSHIITSHRGHSPHEELPMKFFNRANTGTRDRTSMSIPIGNLARLL